MIIKYFLKFFIYKLVKQNKLVTTYLLILKITALSKVLSNQ